jgi:putative transposase
MEQSMRDVRADSGAERREFNSGAEHLHPANVPLTAAISQPVNSPKGVSSRRLRQKFPDLRRHHCRA